MTYGDGLSDVDISAVIKFHRENKKLATVTAVQPQGRYGAHIFDGNSRGGVVERFEEKPTGDRGWVNGGFFVLSPKVLNYIEGDATVFEREPLEALSLAGELAAYSHRGFWHAMDTLRDKIYLEQLWQEGDAPWQTWKRT
jgi:glucose-1-phosphate cytidylyltransferase